MEKVVHLRHLVATNQCELVVNFDTVFHDISIREEMHSVRKATDTIGSLIEHTKNKLKKIINDDESHKSKHNSTEEEYDIPISMFRIKCRRVKDISQDFVLKEFIKKNGSDIFMKILGEQFKILLNPPLIKSMHLPSVLYSSYCVQPLRFYGLYTNISKSEFTWYRSQNKTDWQEVGKAFEYSINAIDVGYFLKVGCVPVSSKGIIGPYAETISKRCVQEFPELPICPFEARHEHTKKLLDEDCFRFVTYNTLSNRYTELNDTFSYCPLEFLSIDYRKQLIMKELIGYNADIICLQEIDNLEYNTYYKSLFLEQGFVSKFFRKGGNLTEGLFCAVRKSRFKLLCYECKVLANAVETENIFQPLYKAIEKNLEFKELFMKQATILQTMILKCKSVKKILVIGNTHLYYRPDATSIRLIQAYVIVKYLAYVREKMTTEWRNFEIDVILCGDFNSNPDGIVYELLTKGEIPMDNEIYSEVEDHTKFSHELDFISACGTPKYTNYTNDFKGCLDYIFIENNKMEVKKVVPLPEEELEQYIGLPNSMYPSDHLALVVDLKLNNQT